MKLEIRFVNYHPKIDQRRPILLRLLRLLVLLGEVEDDSRLVEKGEEARLRRLHRRRGVNRSELSVKFSAGFTVVALYFTFFVFICRQPQRTCDDRLCGVCRVRGVGSNDDNNDWNERVCGLEIRMS